MHTHSSREWQEGSEGGMQVMCQHRLREEREDTSADEVLQKVLLSKLK
jgi:hypothetical protein